MTNTKCSMADCPGPCGATLGTIAENDRLTVENDQMRKVISKLVSNGELPDKSGAIIELLVPIEAYRAAMKIIGAQVGEA